MLGIMKLWHKTKQNSPPSWNLHSRDREGRQEDLEILFQHKVSRLLEMQRISRKRERFDFQQRL